MELHSLGMPMQYFLSHFFSGIQVTTVVDTCVDYSPSLSLSCPFFRILDDLPSYEEAFEMDLVLCYDLLCPCCVYSPHA
jgi:hypothetical protein